MERPVAQADSEAGSEVLRQVYQGGWVNKED
jgi:hypothetical protein